MKKAALVLFVLGLFSLGCQTRIIITTDPTGSEVFVGDTRIGRTPIGLGPSSLAKAESAGGFLLRLEKPGFNRVWVLIPQGHRNVRLDLNLKPLAAAQFDGKIRPEAAQTAEQRRQYFADSAVLLEQQTRLIQGQTLDTSAFSRIKQAYPDSGAPFALEGLSAYVSGNREEAEKAFKNALGHNPFDEDFHAIMNVIHNTKPGGAP